MNKKISKRVGVILDLSSVIFGAFLFLLHFFKIVPGFGSTLALAVTVVIAYLGPIGLIMVVLGVADLLKDRLSGPEEDETDDYYEGDDGTDLLKVIFGPEEDEADDYYGEGNGTRDF